MSNAATRLNSGSKVVASVLRKFALNELGFADSAGVQNIFFRPASVKISGGIEVTSCTLTFRQLDSSVTFRSPPPAHCRRVAAVPASLENAVPPDGQSQNPVCREAKALSFFDGA